MNLICGINPVLEALGAGTRHFDRLLVVKGIRNRRVSEAISRASRKGIPLRFEAREALDRLSGGIPHQGLIAVVSAKPVLALEELLGQARTPALLVVLDGVEDPRNLGAILRTAEAAGADGVLLPERHSAGLSETVSRASAGGLEHVSVARIGNVAQALELMKARGLWVVGFDAAGTERWDTVDLRRPTVLVLGGEGRGIRRLVRERCDQLASLPLFGHVGSLNVSVVAGVALYEAVRQRGAVPSHVRPIPPAALAAAPRRIVGPDPDDAEQDPGAGAAAPGVVHPAAALDDGAPGAVEEPEPRSSLIHIHEEAAWALQPLVQRSTSWTPERGRPGHKGRSQQKRRGAGGVRAAQHQDGQREDRAPGRRRRRRGRKPATAAETPGQEMRRPAAPPGTPAGDGGGASPGADGQARRRRRRRRR
jgi:23S rRNA (guanosine2251-2'-O)-methyltransferase